MEGGFMVHLRNDTPPPICEEAKFMAQKLDIVWNPLTYASQVHNFNLHS